VLMINSHPLHSSFYDLLNQHYATMPTRVDGKPGTQYLANIAVGSFSRPCPVHPDFRVVVHVPVSRLPHTPLPFLNRFEKYSLSIEDALTERLTALAVPRGLALAAGVAPGAVADQDAAAAALFGAVRAGVTDFVAAFSPLAFFGLVPGETVAALTLRLAEDYARSRSAVPGVRPTFHVDDAATAHVAGAGTEEEDTAANEGVGLTAGGTGVGSPLTRVREYVRAVNFQLLQIARPEALYLQRARLPAHYRREYVAAQEHFSACRLLRHVASAHWRVGGGARSLLVGGAAKWVVFTRTSGELLRLHSDRALQALLVAGAAPAVDMVAGFRCELLSVLGGSHAVESAVRTFFESGAEALGHRRLLVLVADMAAATKVQVNFARHVVDEAVGRDAAAGRMPPLVVLLLHSPPEWLQLKSVYNAVPVNGWEFAYCDSLGVEADGATAGGTAAAAVAAGEDGDAEDDATAAERGVPAPAGVAATLPRLSVTDPRRWMLVVFGLLDRPSSDTARAEFGRSFMHALAREAEALRVQGRLPRPYLARRGVAVSAAVYAAPLPRQTPAQVAAAQAAFIAPVQ
jgi:hypothetical protein